MLPNGMRYYIRRNSRPKRRAAIALAVRVGSVVEEDHERGVAHILEHLAFNATERYTNHELVKFLESVGAPFGACQNARTGPDDTVYEFMVPITLDGSGDGGAAAGGKGRDLISETLAVLAEIAFRIRCSEQDLAKERGAVMDEYRIAMDAEGRQGIDMLRLLMRGTKYAERAPIGIPDVINGVTATQVKAFYERWYCPSHMAVVVVGDIEDTAAVELSIQRYGEEEMGVRLGAKVRQLLFKSKENGHLYVALLVAGHAACYAFNRRKEHSCE